MNIRRLLPAKSRWVAVLWLVVAGLLLSYLLFPIICSFVERPYVVTLRYSVRTEGTYTLRFAAFTFPDPSTTFYSPADGLTKLHIARKGRGRVLCWVSNYEFTASERLLGQYRPVLEEAASEYPGHSLSAESLGAAGQPYRTLVFIDEADVELSFHGRRRTIDCPAGQPETQLTVRTDDSAGITRTFSDEPYSLEVAGSNRGSDKISTVFVPSYAFGGFHVTGPEGFTLAQGILRQLGSPEEIPYGTIPFPYWGLIASIVVAVALSVLAHVLWRHALDLLKAEHPHRPWPDAAPLSKKDLSFLILSGVIVLTFTGSVPPIHMVDSVQYVATAAGLRELFATYTYPPYRNPGYPLFILLMRKVMGPGYGLILVQEFLFFLTTFLLFKTVEHFTKGARLAAWIAGLLYLLNPLNLIFSQFIQPEGLWRDLMVLWAFSLVLVTKRNPWGVVVGGVSLGLLWLSRSSALPSVLLCTAVGSLAAAKGIPRAKYVLATGFLITLVYSPYYYYLRAAGTMSSRYFASIHHVASFLSFDRTLDESASCFAASREELAGVSSWTQISWVKPGFFTPLRATDPTAKEAVAKAEAFEKCVYLANYLRFPREQLAALGKRLGSSLWSRELKDRDLWDYGNIYTRRRFLAPEARTFYLSVEVFIPYFYSEKWDAQGFPSLWKVVLEALYRVWPHVDLAVLVISGLGLALAHVGRPGGRTVPLALLPLVTGLGLLYVADAAIYAVFGAWFFRRLMLASAPMVLLVFGIIVGCLLKQPGAAPDRQA